MICGKEFADKCLAESNKLIETLDFSKILEKNGVGALYGIVRKVGETDKELEERINETIKGTI